MKKIFGFILLLTILAFSGAYAAQSSRNAVSIFCGKDELVINKTTKAQALQHCGNPYREKQKRYYTELKYYKASGELELKFNKRNKLVDIEFDTTH